MAVEVGRYLSEIEDKAKELQKTITTLTKENRALDKSLKYDPKNTETLTQKTRVLESAISLATEKLTLLKKEQDNVTKAFSSGEISAQEYHEFGLQVATASAQVADLNNRLEETNKKDFSKLKSSFQAVSNLAKATLVSLAGIVTAYATTGDEVSKMMDKFKIGAEDIQRFQLYFDRASGDAGNFKAALNQVNMQLGALEKGSAKAVKAFEMLGLGEEELEGLNAAQALELIIKKLQEVEDEATRTSIATALLGSAGANVALVAEFTAEEIQALNEELQQTGIITDEQAIKAGELNDKLDTVKFTFMATAAELGSSLIPVMEVFINVINSVLPLVTKLTDGFNKLSPAGKTLVVILIALVAILPKLITIGTALIKVVKGINAATAIAAGKFLAIAAAVALAVELVLQLINALNKLRGVESDLSLKNLFSGGVDDLGNVNLSTAGATGSSTVVNNNYNYDYSTTTNEFTEVVDAEEVIEVINNQIKARR